MTRTPNPFRALTPRPWCGHYKKVPGDTTGLHVAWLDGGWTTTVLWRKGDETATCRMIGHGASELANAVNVGKEMLGGGQGGAFLVDEYGRVLVPSSGGSAVGVYVVGEWTGPMTFENPFRDGALFDLYDDAGLEIGAPWDRPYVGIPYQLSRYDELYFWEQDGSGGRKVTPRAQDASLIEELRGIRPYGPVRFLVAPGGVVVTKAPPLWEPRYVGRLDLDKWFPKAELK